MEMPSRELYLEGARSRAMEREARNMPGAEYRTRSTSQFLNWNRIALFYASLHLTPRCGELRAEPEQAEAVSRGGMKRAEPVRAKRA